MKKNLVLLGMMGVGKTTLGKIVAEKLGLVFIDTDQNIEKENLMTISEIFKRKGEKFFRKLEEKEALKSLKKNTCLIALGGGAFMNEKIRDYVLKNSLSIWLDINIKTLIKRLEWNQNRPLLKDVNINDQITKIYELRKKFYEQAHHKINCNELNKSDIVKKIIIYYEKH